MSLKDALDKWAQSPSGKSVLMNAKNEQIRSAGSYTPIFGDGDLSLEDIAYSVMGTFDYWIKEAGFDFGEYLEFGDIQTVRIGDEVGWEIEINFDWSKIGRDSWYPEKYPHGAYDIVKLMNNGYDASDYVYKTIDGENGKKINVRSLKTRDGAYFMQRGQVASNAGGETKGYWVEIHPRFTYRD